MKIHVSRPWRLAGVPVTIVALLISSAPLFASTEAQSPSQPSSQPPSATPVLTDVSTNTPTVVNTGDLPPPPPLAHRSVLEIIESWFPFFGNRENDVDPAGAPADAIGGIPDAMHGSGLSSLERELSPDELKHALPWSAPDYGGQTNALGWRSDVFTPSASLRGRVNFWKDIYAKYTTQQGVIHDTIFIEIVYAPMDFSPLAHDPSTNTYQRARMREKMIEDKKIEISERLMRLQERSQTIKTAQGLTGEDLRVWKMFESIEDPDKFRSAAMKGRVRFQSGQKDKFQVGIFYSGRYLREMEKIFKEEGLPIELTRLPFVESSFNINARSKVGASGIWQFMPRTARSFMRVGTDVDERNDPLTATRAAARVLKQNFNMLESWPLALTGYNHGPYGVRGIVNRLGTHDLGEIIQRYSSKTFGFASENFYACFVAALETERDAQTYFGDAKWSPAFEGGQIKLAKALPFKNLVEFFDGDSHFAAQLNPHLLGRVRDGKASLPKGTFLRVPLTRVSVVDEFLKGHMTAKKFASELKAAPIPPSPYSAESALDAADQALKIRLGQTSQTEAVVLPILLPKPDDVLVPGPVQVPIESASVAPVPLRSAAEKLRAREIIANTRTHKVKRGENLMKIALTYGVDLQDLRAANQLGEGAQAKGIRPGQVLKIPSPASPDNSDDQPDEETATVSRDKGT